MSGAAGCVAPLKSALQVDLYFGRGMAKGEVSDADWATFLNEEVTPRFPDGLSVLDMSGQWRGASGGIEHERSKRMTVIVFDAPAHSPKVSAIVESYRKRFAQEAVLRTERPICAGL